MLLQIAVDMSFKSSAHLDMSVEKEWVKLSVSFIEYTLRIPNIAI
jgi:hypothetical protein